MQVYRGMDIGTAKATPAQRAGVPHHLIDLADPGEDFSVTQWVGAARDVLAGIEARGSTAILVGGSGLYVQALVDGFEPPGRWPDIAAELDAEVDTVSLHRRLVALDALGASRMEPSNRRRVIRALEVTLGSGRRFSSFGPGLRGYQPSEWYLAGIDVPRQALAERITNRLQRMLDAGLVDEVHRLASREGGWSRTARQALGYREIATHIEDGVPLAEASEAADRHTRRFSVRQRSWWRQDPRIKWSETSGDTLALAGEILRDWSQTWP